MSRADVIALLGVPPGDYTTVPVYYLGDSGLKWVGCEGWACDAGLLRVQFDDDGRATSVEVSSVAPLERPSLLSRLRRLVRR